MNLACAAEESGESLRVLDARHASFVEAVAARIIPTDHRPGAREAGVIRFIDMALDTQPRLGGVLGLIGDTMTALEAEAGARFVDLSEVEQDELLGGIETEPTFAVIQFLTVAGFLSLPKHGGNQAKVGWELIGFDDRPAWTAPFGFYDAAIHDGEVPG